jgi:hypothetical protein
MVMMAMDFTYAEKRECVLGLVQVGIDIYEAMSGGHTYHVDGGFDHGFLFPVLVAGHLMNNAGMKNLRTTFPARRRYLEDGRTNYATDVSANPGQTFVAYWGCWVINTRTGGQAATYYLNGCTGVGSKTSVPNNLNGDGCNSYLGCCTSTCWPGISLVCKVMGIENLLQHDAFFDYVDRWMGYGNDPQTTDFRSGVINWGDGNAFPNDSALNDGRTSGADSKAIDTFWTQERANYS